MKNILLIVKIRSKQMAQFVHGTVVLSEVGAICLTHAMELAENSVIWGRKFGLYRNSFEKKGASPNFAV